MSEFLITCTDGSRSSDSNCTVATYTPPHIPSAYAEHGFSGLTIFWFYVIVSLVGLALILTTAIVRWKAHAERGETERYRIRNPSPHCPICGADRDLMKEK